MSREKILELQKELEEEKKRKDKAEGASEQIIKRIKKERGAGTIREAKELRAEKMTALDKLQKKIERKEKEFEKKWQRHLQRVT